MGLLSDIQLRHDASPREVAQAAEALVLKQVLSAVHVGGQGGGPGASLRADLFAEALAEAVAKGGGIGLQAALDPPKSLNSRDSHPALNALPNCAETEAERHSLRDCP
jgi:hypothetical protein